MSTFATHLRDALALRRKNCLYRTRPVADSPCRVMVDIDGGACLNFSSNDYLGLANHPEVIDAFKKAADQFGVGSGASHLVSGHSTHHHALEEELAAFTGRDRVLLFSTGYMANLGVIDALTDKGDSVFQDRLNHASMIDAGRLSRADVFRFQPGDVQSLERQLQKQNEAASGGKKLIATDGVFSMDGAVANLTGMADIAGNNDAWLMVDDAHGFGVLGDNGGGCAEHFGLDQNRLPVLMGTLGKAFGTFGAFVAGSEELIEYLIQSARTYIYTTALPPAVAAATRVSLKLLQTEAWRRDTLGSLVERFRQAASHEGLTLLNSPTPIQPVILGDDGLTQRVGQRLRDAGFLVGAIRPPTVPKGSARLRVTFTAEHSAEQVDNLVAAIAEAVEKERVSA